MNGLVNFYRLVVSLYPFEVSLLLQIVMYIFIGFTGFAIILTIIQVVNDVKGLIGL